MSDDDRSRPRKTCSLARDVHAFLSQPEINASRYIEAAVRAQAGPERIEEAAANAGMDSEEIEEARR